MEAIKADFDVLGVQRVGISPDSVADAAKMREKNGLTLTLLSDPGLKVTDLYNLRDPVTGGKTPIPATILIGADGLVKWIHVVEHYSRRPKAQFVLAEVRAALGQ